MDIQPRPGAALLFDIDGTLANTDEFHLAAINEVFAPLGERFDHTRYQREVQGFANADIAKRLLPVLPPERHTEIMGQKEAAFRRLVSGSIRPVAGLFPFLDWADRAGIPFAAVTNAPRENVEAILSGLGVQQRFRVIVIGDELPQGKPHPLPYLEALRRLGAQADASLAFEDSRSGIRSASGAGLATLGLATSLTPDDLVAAGAVAAIRDFRDTRLSEWVRKRLGR
jgi:beta-phosphoglucomutase-like phosphatase (HAD superfamily)